jgi:hypothetical protein
MINEESRKEIDAFKEAYKRDPNGTLREIERKIAEARLNLSKQAPIFTRENEK